MRVLFLILLNVFISISLIGQACLYFGVTFSTQSQIDHFKSDYPGCKIIFGEVLITGTDISNIDSLNEVQSIESNLTIAETEILNDLSGFESLNYINGNVSIHDNKALMNFEGLSSLLQIQGNLEVKNNDSLRNFYGFESLSEIAGNFIVSDNDKLENFGGLNVLSKIDGNFSIFFNESLKTFLGLNTLKLIVGYFNVQINRQLQNLSGLDSLKIVNSLVLRQNELLESLFGLEHIESKSLYSISVSSSPLLSMCAIEPICKFLIRDTIHVTIEDNAPGCNNIGEVLNACLVSSEAPLEESSLLIYPNPASDFLMFRDLNTIPSSIILTDCQGRLITNYSVSNNKIDISNLTPGFYFISIESKDQRSIKRVIKGF